jgi:hypothetical protein
VTWKVVTLSLVLAGLLSACHPTGSERDQFNIGLQDLGMAKVDAETYFGKNDTFVGFGDSILPRVPVSGVDYHRVSEGSVPRGQYALAESPTSIVLAATMPGDRYLCVTVRTSGSAKSSNNPHGFVESYGSGSGLPTSQTDCGEPEPSNPY